MQFDAEKARADWEMALKLGLIPEQEAQVREGLKQLPGIGPADFTPWIAALAKARYRWYVNPFMHGHPEPEEMAKSLARSVEYLKECYSKVKA